jgi:hypothetical protein
MEGIFLASILLACIIDFHHSRKLMGAAFGKSFNCLISRLPGRYLGDDLME